MSIHHSIVGNHMICPDLFRKVMFSNPLPLTGRIEVGGHQTPILMGVLWGLIYKKTSFFPGNYMRCIRTANYSLIRGRVVEGPIHEKTFMVDILWNVKLMFSIPSLLEGVLVQFTKTLLLEIHKLPELQRNFMFGNLLSIGRTLSHITKRIVGGNCKKCIELHETHVFPFPTSPQRVGGFGSNA